MTSEPDNSSKQPQLRPPGPDQDTATAGEQELWSGRAAGRAFMLSWILFAVIIVGLLLLTYGTPLRGWRWSWIAWLIILGLIICQLVRVGYKIIASSYRVTTQRLFIRRGLLVTTTNQTDLLRVNDVQVRQNVLEKVMGVGTVIVDSPSDSTNPHAELTGVLDPHAVAEHIHRQMCTLRDRKTLMMEAT
jgi:membrane protein YdbS with pleckstrin-like domain